jgi:hypothetical protein
MPDVPTDAPFAFAQTISSRRSFAGTAFFDTTSDGWSDILEHVILKRVNSAVDDVSSQVSDADRVSIRRSSCNTIDTDTACGTDCIFYDDCLPKRGSQRLYQNTGQSVGGPPAANGTTIVIGREG